MESPLSPVGVGVQKCILLLTEAYWRVPFVTVVFYGSGLTLLPGFQGLVLADMTHLYALNYRLRPYLPESTVSRPINCS